MGPWSLGITRPLLGDPSRIPAWKDPGARSLLRETLQITSSGCLSSLHGRPSSSTETTTTTTTLAPGMPFG